MQAASRKDTLLKLLPRRFVPNSETVFVGGNNYETSFIPRKPETVYQIISGNLTSISFSYDDNTGVTTFTTSSTPNDNIFADYPLYYSTLETQYLKDDPYNDTGDIAEWVPRLAQNFRVGQESKDLLNGVLTVSTSSARVINEDFELNQYLTRYDNYFNAPFNAYAVIGDNIYKLSNGVIASFVAGKNVTFRLKSQNKLYERIASLGNARKYWKFSASDYPSGNSKDFGSFIINTRSFVSVAPSFNVNYDNNQHFRPTVNNSDLFKCKYVSSTRFLVGVSRNPFPADFNVPVTYNGNVGPDPDGEISVESYTIPLAYVKYFFLGCRVTAQTGGGSSSFQWPIKSINYSTGVVTINGPAGLPFFRLGPAWVTNTPLSPATYGNTLGMPTNDLSFNSYRFATETATNGDTLIYMDAFGAATFDRNDQFYSLVMSQDDEDQTDLAEELITSSGLTVNASEFATAQSEANNKVLITLPAIGESQLKSAGYYLERIAKSNNGLFYINDQTEQAGYKIINTNLSGVDWTVTSTEILEPELVPSIEYQDTIDSISTTNESYKLSNYISGMSNDATSNFGKYFNQIENNLEDQSDNLNVINASNEKIDRLKEPAYFYRFSLKSDDYFLMQIGEIVKITDVGNKLLTDDTEVDVIVVSIRKSSELIEVTGYEFSRIS